MSGPRVLNQGYIISANDTPSNDLSSSEESSDESSLELQPVEIATEEEYFWSALRDKKNLWKGAGVLGAVMTTLTYLTTYELTHNPVYAACSTLIPVGLGVCAAYTSKFTNNKNLELGLNSFTFSSALGTTLNVFGALIPSQAAYPMVVPIVSLSMVTCSNIMTPELCMGVTEIRDKLSKLSNHCFSLWNAHSSQKNADIDLKEVVSEKSNLLLRS